MKKFKRKVLDMLMSNNSGSNLRQQLFDGAPFCSELLYTAIPQRAASGTTGTFTRATTKTWQNNDGYLVTGVAGEIGFPGARRVRNLVTGSSNDLNNAYFTKSNVGTGVLPVVTSNYAADPIDGVVRASRLVLDIGAGTGTGDVSRLYMNGGSAISNCATQFYAKSNTANSYVVDIGGGGVNRYVTITPNWQLFTPAIFTSYPTIMLQGGTACSQYADISVCRYQNEDVTAQTTQTAGEYVSVGVPSDWAGDELVTNGTFDTDTDWTTDANITIGGGVMTCTLSGTSVGTPFSVVAGTKYVVSWDCTRFVTGANRVLVRKADTTVIGGGTQDTTGVTAVGRYIREFTSDFTGTVQPQVEFPINGESDVDNISVKPAYYHGSMVDGIKCFPTDLAGNAIPSTTLLGYQAEGARTNLCLQSNAFTTTWGTSGAPAAAQNAIGPDGATSAWTVTDANAGTFDGYVQTISASAGGVYCQSLFIKKAASATAYPLVQLQVNTAGQYVAIIVNHVAGTINVVSGGVYVAPVASRIEDFNSDYWRVQVSGTQAGGTLTIAAEVYPAASSDGTTLSAAAQGSAVFYGAQLELGSFASSYIATTTAAVTRNADVLTYSSAGNIANAAGWVYAKVTAENVGATTQADVLTDSATFALYSRNDAGKQRFYNGTVDENLNDLSVPYANKKLAWSWTDAVSVLGAVDGTVASAAISGNLNIGANLRLGGGVGNALFGNIGPLYIGQRQLSASELQAVTS